MNFDEDFARGRARPGNGFADHIFGRAKLVYAPSLHGKLGSFLGSCHCLHLISPRLFVAGKNPNDSRVADALGSFCARVRQGKRMVFGVDDEDR
jgi:hypothetical protein